MTAYRWTLHDAGGNELRATDDFASREAAEEWLGREWGSLVDEGAEAVSLRSNGEELYRMSLAPE
ncbi:MAG: hypothetical protein ACRDJ5_01035 [Actinomycetota bacterium]